METDTQTFYKPAERKVIAKCPKCGGDVAEFDTPKFKAFACQTEKEKCGFVLWKTVAGKTLTETQAKALCTKKKTALIKGFKGKTKEFDAYLVLKDDFTVGFEFEKK